MLGGLILKLSDKDPKVLKYLGNPDRAFAACKKNRQVIRFFHSVSPTPFIF